MSSSPDAKGKKRERNEQQQLVTASIKSFLRPKLEDCTDEADYKRRLQARDGMVLREKERILSTITAPRDERDDKLLRWECEVKGIASEGIRAILLQRLAGHDQGQRVLMAGHMNQAKAARIDPEEARESSLAQKAQVIRQLGNGRGEDGFLALPHDMIRHALLPYVDLFSLVCLARTCKYLTNDVTQELWKRARLIFGKDGGTPKAIGVFMAMSTNYHTVTPLVRVDNPRRFYQESWWSSCSEGVIRDRMQLWCKKLGVKYEHQFGATNAAFLAQRIKAEVPFLNRGAIRGHDYEALTVALCIRKHKTVEAALASARLRAEKADLLVEERKTLALDEKARVEALNKCIGFELFSPGTDNGRELASKYCHLAGRGSALLLDLTPLGQLFYALSAGPAVFAAHKKCTNHIYKGDPKTVAGGASGIKELINPLGSLSRILHAVQDIPVEKGRSRLIGNYGAVDRYAWVFTHLGGLVADISTNRQQKEIVASLCEIASRPEASGLDRMQNPENYLNGSVNPLAFAQHCVILIVCTEEYNAVRIVYLNQRVKWLDEAGSRVYTISRDNVLDALPLSDEEMKRKLRHGLCGIYRNPSGPPLTYSNWQQSRYERLVHLDVKYSTAEEGRSTAFGGIYYRPQWMPFAPMSVIIK